MTRFTFTIERRRDAPMLTVRIRRLYPASCCLKILIIFSLLNRILFIASSSPVIYESTRDSNGYKFQGAGQPDINKLGLAIAFVSPIAAVAIETHHAGGGILLYALDIFLAFALAVFIVWADWKLGKLLWLDHNSI